MPVEEENPLLGLDAQMVALFAIIVATIISIMTLQGLKEQQSGVCPEKDYSFLKQLPKVSTAILLAAGLYFLYLAYHDHKANPENSRLNWLFIANLAAVTAALIRADIAYLPGTPSEAQLTEEVE